MANDLPAGRDDRPEIETLTARDELFIAVVPYDCDREEANARIDAYRAEVLAEAKVETVAWLVKKAAEQKKWDAAVLASKLDRGAVRIFLGTGHYRDAMDAHRAEVLREAADVAEKFTERWPDLDAMKADGIIGPFTAFGRLADELRDMADAKTDDAADGGR